MRLRPHPIDTPPAPIPRSGWPVASFEGVRTVAGALFGTPLNAVITSACLWLIWWGVWAAFRWLVLDAVVSGGAEACRFAHGACWPFVVAKLRFILFGIYPYEEQWRMAASLLIFSAIFGLSMLPRFWNRTLIVGWLGSIVVFAVLMSGGVFGLRYVPVTRWSGLPLSVMLSFIGVGLGFPIGVLLALARSSSLPAIRGLAILFIELVRAVPLIAVLFMASIMMPLLLPSGLSMDVLLRVQIAIVVFAAVYIAEAVRGALQAIPREQYDAALSLGLRYWSMMALIVLPQALKIAIPSLMVIVIGFFQDTSLVTAVGLLDLLGTVRAAMHDPTWQGVAVGEGYMVAASIYFVISFLLGGYGRFLERRTQTGRRRA